MSWLISKNSYSKEESLYHKISNKDIIVYKFGFLNDKKNFFPYHYKDFVYIKNRDNPVLKIVLIEEEISNKLFFNIKEGYHGYSENCKIYFNNDKGKIYSLFYNEIACTPYNINSVIGMFLIPKGIEYYENDNGEIVSSQLIWTGKYCYSINIKDNKIKFKDLNICVGV